MSSSTSSTTTPSAHPSHPLSAVTLDSNLSRNDSSAKPAHFSHHPTTSLSSKSTDTPPKAFANSNAYTEATSTSSSMPLSVPTRPSTSADTSSATATKTTPSQQTETANTSASTPGYRPLNVKDALAYLDQVKVRFGDRPDVYNRFLDIMKDFKHQIIDTPGVIERVFTLFQGNPALISGFNTFLPFGYHIECSTDPQDPDLIRVTTPSGIITTSTSKRPYPPVSTPSIMDKPPMMTAPIYYGPPYGHSHPPPFPPTSHDQQQSQTHYAPPHPFYQYEQYPQQHQNYPQSQPLQSHHQQHHPSLPLQSHQYPQPSYQHQQPQQQPPSQHPPLQNSPPQIASRAPQSPTGTKRPLLDFNNAISYVNKIKNRFTNNPDSYKQFLEVLQTYQKEEKKIEDVYSHVKVLFMDHADLLEEFQQFLPGVGEIQEPSKRVLSSTEISPFIPAGKKKRGANKKTKPGLDAITADDHNEYADHRYLKRSDYGARQGFDPNNPSVSSEEVELFEHIRKHIGNKPSYEVFLKLLNLYSQDIIDLDILMERAYPFMGGKPELYDWFKSIVGYKPNPESSSNIGSAGEKTLIMNMIPKPDLVRCDTVMESPSYRLVPKDWQHQPCSGRDSLCWEVLNDAYVSHPIWASEESGFVASKKNPYEEAMHRCEEERYDYDLNIDANLSSIALLEPIIKNLKTMSLEEQEVYTLSPGLGGESTSIYERIIKKIYGVERGGEVIQMLYSNPAGVAPVVMKRLKQKDEEWTKGQREWNRVWREIDEKNYYKSFDYQGLTIKASERKTLTSRYLLNEIESKYHHEDNDGDLDRVGTDSLSTGRKKKSTSSSSRTTRIINGSYSQFMYTFGDEEIFKDISLLILSYMEHQNGFSKADCDRVRRFIQNFIPSFFLVDDVIPIGYTGAAADGDHYSHFVRNKNDGAKNAGTTENDDEDDEDDDDGDDDDDDDTNSTSTPSDDSSDVGQQGKGGKKKQQQRQVTSRTSRTSRASRASRASSRIKNASLSSSQEQSTDKEVKLDSTSDDNESNLEQSQPLTATDELNNTCNPSDQQTNNLISSPSPISEVAGSSVSSSMNNENQLPLQHLVLAAKLTTPKFYKRDVNSLFGNSHLYCFLRLFETLYARLYKMKQLDKRMQANPKRGQFNATAMKLGLKGTRFDDVDTTHGYYQTLLEQTDRLFSSNVDSTMYEEIIRYLFKTEAYVFFTVDKLVHAIVKQIQTLAGDEKSMHLIRLYQDNQRISDAATYQPLSVYHSQAEDITGQNEHLFKLNFNIDKKQLSIHLLGQDEKLDDQNLQHENYLESFMNWTKMEKVTQKRTKSYLLRNIRSGFKSLENVVVENKLQYCIRHDTYQLGFRPGSEDMLCLLSKRNGSLTPDTEVQTQDLMIAKDRQQIH
ncbi:hypothetical protein BCR42DRAFT_447079 [Absidia repens]|uniref:Histone deacetylase interacting domain-containing protein n=1 Tax=Absidia repens TaxID=90262 RepID=A0A1X2IWG3_9FUNG|nr:hypothetical protein BCR42DRAFT_447079 [Absidia repens]